VEIKCEHALFSPFLVKHRDISPSERPHPGPFQEKKPETYVLYFGYKPILDTNLFWIQTSLSDSD